MKKRLFILLLLSVILLPFTAKAEDVYEFKSVNISAVFITQADVSGISKIKVYYTTFSNGTSNSSEVILLKENNFSTTISVGSINDAIFNYGYCITYDDKKDIYGFLPITSSRTLDGENKTVRINLKVDFNAMNYDGVKYRQNSDLTEEDFLNRVRGKVTPETSTTTSNNNDNTTTNTSTDEDGNIIIGTTESTTTVLSDNNQSNREQNKKQNNDDKGSLRTLLIILGVIGVLVLIFIVHTSFKMYQANKRV